MSSEFTQQQTPSDQQRSKELSLQRTRPPADVPGYQAQRFLGAGAYGEVWAGIDQNTGRKVAIKFYAHRRGVDWSLLRREVEKLVFLSADRYVVQLLEVGWDADPPYYVMEYVENGSLDDLLRRQGTFTVPEAVEMIQEIAVGLAHAHGKGVLHCDLKPANILLDQDHRPRLADFGQSRLSNEQKPALGTLFYMAPEQADLEAVPDVRWDIYALGAMFYCMLVGYPPHRNDTTVGKIDSAGDLADRLARYRQAIRTAPPANEHRKLPGMDRALADIIERCLAPNPSNRFANVQEVLDALQTRVLNKARLPMMVLGFVGPLLVLLITALFSWRGYERAVENAETGYRKWAVQNNKYASEVAAERVTAEIGRYFDLARREADRPEFRPPRLEVLASPSLVETLSNPNAKEEDIEAARKRFLDEPPRRALDRYLESRLKNYKALAERDPRAPQFASIFVTDRYGTQLASAFEEDFVSKSIGKNWAHRSYFHGGPTELPPFPRPQPNAKHIEQTSLSSVFKSTTSKRWKVAIATPIMRERFDGEREFEGVLVLTVNLGDFEFFRSGISGSHDQFAVLVDGREGEFTGTILQHPLFNELMEERRSLPEEFREPQYRVPARFLTGKTGGLYEDPLSRFDHKLAEPYRRNWVAAASRVRSPVTASDDRGSGLVVLVQSDYQSVVEPARQLGDQFIRNNLSMLAVVIVVSLSLWYIVVRMFREPRAPLGRTISSAREPTPINSLTTIAAPRDVK